MEDRPPVANLEMLSEQQRLKKEAKLERRAAKRRGELTDEPGGEEGPTLKERHTNVIGGPQVVGGEERVVLERETVGQ